MAYIDFYSDVKHENNKFSARLHGHYDQRKHGRALIFDGPDLRLFRLLVEHFGWPPHKIHIVEFNRKNYDKMQAAFSELPSSGRPNVHNMLSTDFLEQYEDEPFSFMCLDYVSPKHYAMDLWIVFQHGLMPHGVRYITSPAFIKNHVGQHDHHISAESQQELLGIKGPFAGLAKVWVYINSACDHSEFDVMAKPVQAKRYCSRSTQMWTACFAVLPTGLADSRGRFPGLDSALHELHGDISCIQSELIRAESSTASGPHLGDLLYVREAGDSLAVLDRIAQGQISDTLWPKVLAIDLKKRAMANRLNFIEMISLWPDLIGESEQEEHFLACCREYGWGKRFKGRFRKVHELFLEVHESFLELRTARHELLTARHELFLELRTASN